MKKSVLCSLLICIVLLLTPSLVAQVASTGAVLGTVSDQSGAVVPGATVALTNIATGITANAETDGSGNFSFPIVQVGRYELTVSKGDFKKFVQSDFPVNALANVRINATLTVGQTTEQVVVEATPSAVETVTASEGNTVTGNQVNTLPLTNRIFTQLVTLETGVSQALTQTPGFGSNSSIGFSINGVRSDQNNVLVDGVRNVDTFGGNAYVTPNLFAVSEFRIESNAYSAAAGHSGGGQVNLISRGGTNQFHGNVFEFFRNDKMNASTFWGHEQSKTRYNNFGYDVGGPIKKDKLFFFWSQEWRRFIVSPGSPLATVPTDAEKNGDFSGISTIIKDPTTGQPFAGNKIPASMIDKNAQLLLQNYFPSPIPGFQQGTANYVSSYSNYDKWRQESIRTDYRISDKWSLYGRYTQDSAVLDRPYGQWGENSIPNYGASQQIFPMYHATIHATYVATPSFISEFNTGLYYANDKAIKNLDLSSRARVSGLNIPELYPLNQGDRIPTLYFWDTYTGLVNQWAFHNYAYHVPVENSNTWIHGRHAVKFGIAYSKEAKSEPNASSNNTNGTFTFSGEATGNPLADMLVGKAYSYSEVQGDPFGRYRWFNLEAYAEDQVKVRPNLTLTLGVRYSYFAPEHELDNMFNTFDPGAYNPANAPAINPDGTLVPGTGTPLNGILTAGSTSPYGDHLFSAPKGGFAPRVGLVWDPTSSGKMSVRLGYGIFYDRWGSYSQFSNANPPYNQSTTIYNTLLSNVSNGTADNTQYPAGLSSVIGPWKLPQYQKWSVSVQREVARDTTASVAYVGTKGSHLLGAVNLNQLAPGALASGENIALLRPYLGYSDITAYGTRGNSIYDSLQASLKRRLTRGLEFQASYTWSKTLTDASGSWSTPQDSRNIHAEKGLASFDTPHVLTFNYVWEIPAFKNAQGVKKAALGGWQLSGITTFQAGFALTAYAVGDTAQTASGSQRPNLVGDPNNGPKSIAQWFNTAAFASAATGTFGNAANGVIRGPGFSNWDIGLGKAFPLKESIDLRFKAQFFNAFNHPSYTGVNTSYGDPGFGQVTGVAAPRMSQLSLDLTF